MSEAATSPSPSGRGVRGEGRRPKLTLPSELIDFVRTLRTGQTDPESLFWHLLRDRRLLGLKFRRQHPMPPYVLDFYCDEIKLAVELDGGQHNQDEIATRDAERDRIVAKHGIELVRYWNHDVMLRTENVLEDLVERALKRRPSPGPAGHPLPEGEGKRGAL
jgi:very-short-patch-repair endonuclease